MSSVRTLLVMMSMESYPGWHGPHTGPLSGRRGVRVGQSRLGQRLGFSPQPNREKKYISNIQNPL
jgi:hypothetical protein